MEAVEILKTEGVLVELELYEDVEVVEPGEIPIVNCERKNMAETLWVLCADRESLREIGERSRRYVEKRHSTEAIGKVFAEINRSLGLEPREERRTDL